MASAQSDIDELLTGLNSPKGVALLGRDVVVSQGAFGPPDPVLLYLTTGRDRGATIPVSDPTTLLDVAISPLDGSGWGIVTDGEVGFLVVHQLADGTVVEVLDLAAYQAGDPDPVDQEGNPTESNGYGLTIAPNGDALVADAAGNDIIRVTPEGEAWTVARFDVEATPTDHLPVPRSAGDRRRSGADVRDVRARRRHLRRPAQGFPIPTWHVERVAHRRRCSRRVVLGEHPD